MKLWPNGLKKLLIERNCIDYTTNSFTFSLKKI